MAPIYEYLSSINTRFYDFVDKFDDSQFLKLYKQMNTYS